MKKVFIFICILLCMGIYAQNISDNDIDPELISFVDELNNEDYKAVIEKINELYSQLLQFDELQGVDFSVYKDRQIAYDEEFMNMSTVDKQKAMRVNAAIKDEMVDALINVNNKNTTDFKAVLTIVKDISYYENELFEIFERMLKASNDNVSTTISILEETRSDLDNAITKLNLAEASVKLLNESLAFQERKNKNAFILGNVLIPVLGGLAIFNSAMLLANTNDNSLINVNTANILLYSSIFVTIGLEIVWNGGHLIFKIW